MSGRTSPAPLFTVVVPTYGRSRLLSEALESVLAQTVDDLEVVVVDDAGPQPAAVPDDPRVRLVRRGSNGGPAAARNTGLEHARGRYVAFLDDDDVYLPGRLAMALVTLETSDIAVCQRADMDGGDAARVRLEGDVHAVVAEAFTPHLGQTTVRRDRCPRFDVRFVGCQDVEWWIRATERLTVGTVEAVGYLVRAHTGPRHLNGLQARIDGSRLLLDVHDAYFAAHPRARAFREWRIGMMCLRAGRRTEARRALARSLRTRPTWRTAGHLLRTLPVAHALPRPGAVAR